MKIKVKFLLTLLLCFIVSIGNANNYKYSKKRTIKANFEMSEDYTLYVYGKFSNYNIQTWGEDNISFHIEIITRSDKEENAMNLLHHIDVEFDNSQTNKSVSAKTVIPKKIKNANFQIDYYIMIPENIFVDIKNLYGDVNIDKLNRYFTMDLDFGNFSLDSLFSTANIDVKYGNTKIKYVHDLKGNVGFGDVRINSGNNVDIILKYGNGKIGEMKTMTAHCEFSDLSCTSIDSAYINVQYTDTYLENVKEVTIDDSFSEVEIEHLLKKINFTSKYGDIEINNVDKDFKYIGISSQFSDVDIVLDKSYKFSYQLSASFGDINNEILKDNAKQYVKENSETTLMGIHNEGTDLPMIKADVHHGDLNIKFIKVK